MRKACLNFLLPISHQWYLLPTKNAHAENIQLEGLFILNNFPFPLIVFDHHAEPKHTYQFFSKQEGFSLMLSSPCPALIFLQDSDLLIMSDCFSHPGVTEE
jgi:hypothetical protein